MEWDCSLVRLRALRPWRRTFEVSKLLLLSVILVISNINSSTEAFYLNCDEIQEAGHCECSKLDVYSIDCPKQSNIYPIQLKLYTNGNPDEAFLEVTCNSLEQPQFQWEQIQGVDLSEDKISAKIVKLSFNRCPAVPEALQGLLNRTNIPTDHIKRLAIRFSENKTIPQNYFLELPNLEILNLSQNQLENVPDLSILTNLEELNMRYNKIKNLHSGTFKKNSKLKRIVLSNNEIELVPPRIFPSSLEHLELSGGRLTTLTKESFENLSNLQHLILENARLRNSQPECFDNLVALKELWLNRAQFTKFPNFKNLPMLTNLSINGIKLEQQPLTIDNLPSLTMLKAMKSEFNILPKISNTPKLKILDLSQNRITALSKGFFTQLPALIHVDLSGNQIRELVEIKAPYLEKLFLGKNLITSLPKTAFVYLMKLTELNLSGNKIDDVDFNAFDNLEELRHLDLSNNEISSKSPFKNIQTHDGLGEFSGNSFINKNIRMQHLNVSHNNLDMIFDDWKNVFTDLRELDLSYNKIKAATVFDLQFITIQNLQLNLSHNEISKINLINHFIFESHSSIDIYIDGNPLICDCFAFLVKNLSMKSHRLHFEELACTSPASLKDDKLSTVDDKELLCELKAKQCPSELCTCWQRPVDLTIVVNCSNLDLNDQTLPSFNWSSGQEFNKWKIYLDFSGNNISHINESYISEFSDRVQFMDLSNNHLKSIGFLNSIRESLKMNVSLAQNPFSCESCSDFVVVWATQTSRIVDSENITCWKDFEELSQLTVQNLPELVDDCSNKIDTAAIQILIICVAVFSTMCIIMIIFMVRYSWIIKAFLFSKGWGWCLFWDNDLNDDDQEKIYDAFISYSHKDEDWVMDELVSRLEAEEGFKLCLHFRDWTPGDWIPDQIVRSVEQSKRTVVVLSKSFLESVWSRLEFKAAHAQALSKGSNRVILVLIEDGLKDQDVQDEDLRVYMKMNTYLKCSDQWFWHKLKYALPHRKSHKEGNKDVAKKMQQREKARELDKIRTKLEQVA